VNSEYFFFWGPKGQNTSAGSSCLSQWARSPFGHDGYIYPTAEHWMMAQKALLFGDNQSFFAILDTPDPRKAKSLGRQVKDFDQALWDNQSYNVVIEGNIRKFSAHPKMKDYLLSTGDKILVEASPFDRIWGIGLTADEAAKTPPGLWPGENRLGKALTTVRDYFQRRQKTR
jgi:ribA/ribD-fused uncharacterized protein